MGFSGDSIVPLSLHSPVFTFGALLFPGDLPDPGTLAPLLLQHIAAKEQ